MTVKELILRLQNFDEDMEVRMLDRNLAFEKFIDIVSVEHKVVYLEDKPRWRY